jgi:hypothetical protein
LTGQSLLTDNAMSLWTSIKSLFSTPAPLPAPAPAPDAELLFVDDTGDELATEDGDLIASS